MTDFNIEPIDHGGFQPCLHENGLKVADYQQVAAIGSAVNAADQFFIAVIILGGVSQLLHGDHNPSIVHVSDDFSVHDCSWLFF